MGRHKQDNMQSAPVFLEFDRDLNATKKGSGSLQSALRRSFEDEITRAESALQQCNKSKEILANKPSNMSDAEMMEHVEWVDLTEVVERRLTELKEKVASLDVDLYHHRRNIVETKNQKRATMAAKKPPTFMEFDNELNPTDKASTPLQDAHTEFIEENVRRAEDMLSKIKEAEEKLKQKEQNNDAKNDAEFFELLEYAELKDTVERNLAENLAKLQPKNGKDKKSRREQSTAESTKKTEDKNKASSPFTAGLGLVGCLGLVGSCLGLGYMYSQSQAANTTIPAKNEQKALPCTDVSATPVDAPALTL